MLDKAVVAEAGIDDVVSALAWGQARYGERIMDQNSNLIMKGIIKSDRPEEDKKRLLGEHVFSELLTHSDMQDKFATGGGTKKKTLADYGLTNDFNKESIVAAKNLYNEWAKKQPGKLPILKVGDGFTQETAKAFSAYNAANVRPLNISGSSQRMSNGDTRFLVKEIGLDKLMPGINIKPANRIVGYDKSGKALFADDGNGPVNYKFDSKTGKLNVINEEYLKNQFPGWEDNKNPNLPINPTNTNISDDVRNREFDNASMVRDGISIGTGLLGASFAATPIPKWKPTPEYEKMRDEIYAKKNEGFSAAEQASINQNIQNNYASGVNAIRSVVGNGGNQGSVLASLGNLSASTNRSYLDAAVQDAGLRRQNQANYQNAVIRDLGIDQQMFDQDRQAAIARQQDGLAMVRGAAENLFQESMFRESYGPDSLYNQYMQVQLDNQKRYSDIADQQAEAFGRYLSGTPTTPTTTPAPAIPIAVNNTVNPLQDQFGRRKVLLPQ